MLETDKKIYKVFFICLALGYAVCSLIFTPINALISSNVLYNADFLVSVLDIMRGFFEIATISVCYAALISVIYLFGAGNAKKYIFVFIVATALKYFAGLGVSIVVFGAKNYDILWEILDVLFFTALETAQFLIVFALVKAIVRTPQKSDLEEHDEHLGYKKIFDFKNCVLTAAFFCAIVTAAAKTLGKIANDALVIFQYGLPTQIVTVFKMILNYTMGIIPGALCYLIIWLAIPRLCRTK